MRRSILISKWPMACSGLFGTSMDLSRPSGQDGTHCIRIYQPLIAEDAIVSSRRLPNTQPVNFCNVLIVGKARSSRLIEEHRDLLVNLQDGSGHARCYFA